VVYDSPFEDGAGLGRTCTIDRPAGGPGSARPTDSPGQPWRRIVQSAEKAGQTSLLIVNRGFGRAVPGAIVYSAAPRTHLWIVSPDDLEQEGSEALISPFRELHVALSLQTETRDKIENWLSRLKATSSFVEQERKMENHRYLIRSGGPKND